MHTSIFSIGSAIPHSVMRQVMQKARFADAERMHGCGQACDFAGCPLGASLSSENRRKSGFQLRSKDSWAEAFLECT